jgi:hypothetical protein
MMIDGKTTKIPRDFSSAMALAYPPSLQHEFQKIEKDVPGPKSHTETRDLVQRVKINTQLELACRSV